MYHFCLDKNELKRASAALILARDAGLIDEAGFEALEKRRLKKNADNELAKKKGETFYGPYHYSQAAYLQYELTRFRLDLVQPKAGLLPAGILPEFSREERRRFYDGNRDLFTRYDGDSFGFEEVEQIIEKRLREEAYERKLSDILCKLEDGE